jgi:hypothetical protein
VNTLAILGVAIGLCTLLMWVAIRRRRRVMADPLLWPRSLSRSKLTQYGNYYLRAAGWIPLEPWEYEDFRVRAAKPGIELNILVVDDSYSSLSAKMRDANETGHRKNAIVGLLTQQVIHPVLQQEAEASGMFLVGPAGLPEVEKAIRIAGAQHVKWREAAAKK